MDAKLKKPKDFLYNRMGPWPQPCPEHPFGEASGVIHLPFSECFDWWLHIGSRYVFSLMYSPIAYLRGLLNPGLEEVDDAEFVDMLTKTMLSKFIKTDFDENDKNIFGDLLEQKDIWICDFEPVKVVKTFKGIFASATKTLLRKENNTFVPLVIYVDETDSVFMPTDGEHWCLAKYFVLQGGALCSTLVEHPLLHFPMDCINAITKTALPKDNVLFQLMCPHLRFTLYLEKAVLTFKTSLLKGKWWMPYAPYPGYYEGLRELLVQGYQGILNNASYPQYKYQYEPEYIVGSYGDFHQAYFKVFKTFVSKILDEIDDTEKFYIGKWADYIKSWQPDFPDGEKILANQELFVSTVAYFLFDVSVGHTVDHYNYGHMNIRKIPLRIRQAPPKKGMPIKMDRKKLTKFWDFGKYEMARRLFFDASTKTALINTQYNFGHRNEKLQKVVAQFKLDLREVDANLRAKGQQFIPLEKIAASIQF